MNTNLKAFVVAFTPFPEAPITYRWTRFYPTLAQAEVDAPGCVTKEYPEGAVRYVRPTNHPLTERRVLLLTQLTKWMQS